MLISEKIDFTIKTVTRVKEGYYIMIKESIQEEDRTSINIHAPKRRGPQHTREILTGIQEETDSDAIIIGKVNSPISSMNRSSRQKINKETQALNDTLDWKDLIDIYRTFNSKAVKYTFLSSAEGRFSRINQILNYKWSLGKYKKTEITSSILSDHNTRR